MTIQNYNVYEGLTSVDLVASNNISGTYTNGNLNNGVGAFLTIPASTFSIDLKPVGIGDSILLLNQTNANENGIYVCIQTGGIYSFSVLQRREDFHSIEQIRGGQYISVANGAVNSGSIYTVVEPLPNKLGLDPILFNSSAASIKNVTIDTPTLDDIESQPFNYVLLNDLTANINSTLSDETSRVIGSSTMIKLNGGITNGVVIGNASQVDINGIASVTDGIVAASAASLDLTEAIINGGQLTGLLVNLTGMGTPTNISSVSCVSILNSTGLNLPNLIHFSGDADNLFDCSEVVNYYATAGVGAGQAGDVTKCNAQHVLKVKINGNNRFIPLFETN